MSSPVRRALACIALVLVAGCPESREIPERPPGIECSADADCVAPGEPACGLVPACVDLRCEAEPTLLVACP